MSQKRTHYSPEFKAKVTLEALRNEETVAELAVIFDIHPTMVGNWKKALIGGASEIFDKGQKIKKQMKPKWTSFIVK